MSGKISGSVWDLALPHAQLLVLLAMADHADHEGHNVFPAVELIAWKTGYSERQVQRILKQLRAAGLLVVMDATPGMTVLYRIDLDAGVKKQPRQRGRQNVTPVRMSPVTQPRQRRGDKVKSPDPLSKRKEKNYYSDGVTTSDDDAPPALKELL